MKMFKLWVRLNPSQTTYTIVYADNVLFAKQIGEHQFGVGNVLSYIEASLKRNADNAKQAYKAEKDRQKLAKAQQQIFKATHSKI